MVIAQLMNILHQKIPRFLIPLTQNYLEYGDKYIKGIYLKNVDKVNGIEVTETNLPQIELIMYKLLSLSNLQEQVRFEPVSEATTMKIGFRVSDDSITKNQKALKVQVGKLINQKLVLLQSRKSN